MFALLLLSITCISIIASSDVLIVGGSEIASSELRKCIYLKYALVAKSSVIFDLTNISSEDKYAIFHIRNNCDTDSVESLSDGNHFLCGKTYLSAVHFTCHDVFKLSFSINRGYFNPNEKIELPALFNKQENEKLSFEKIGLQPFHDFPEGPG